MNQSAFKPFHVVIAGSRNFNDYTLLCQWCDYMLQNYDASQVIIVSGGARGADSLGEKYARERGMGLIIKPADWNRYGKSAGYIRNEQMAKIGDALILFWDGHSPGSKLMLDLAKKHNITNIQVVKY